MDILSSIYRTYWRDTCNRSYKKTCWFGGTRPNYTHQLVGFPAKYFLYLSKSVNKSDYSDNAIVIGKNNSIFDSCLEIPAVRRELRQKRGYKTF